MEENQTPEKDEAVEALLDEILGKKEDGETATPILKPELLSALPTLLSAFNGKTKANDKQTALLMALRPYLCDKRCEAIDYFTKVKGIADAIKHLNL